MKDMRYQMNSAKPGIIEMKNKGLSGEKQLTKRYKTGLREEC